MLKATALLILAVLLAAFAQIPNSLSPSKPAPQQSPTQSEAGKLPEQNRSNEKTPSVLSTPPPEIVDAVSRAIDAAAYKAQATQNSRPPDNSAWWFNFFLVVFTGGLVVVGAFQAIFLRTSVEATEKTANAAKKSADAVEGQLRANVLFETATIANVGLDLTPIAQIELKNFGQGTAYDVVHYVSICVEDFPLSRPLPIHLDVPNVSKSVMAPGVKTSSLVQLPPPPLTQDQWNGLQESKQAIYVFGNIEYRDAFKTRSARYRLMHGAMSPLGSPNLTHCADGNEAD